MFFLRSFFFVSFLREGDQRVGVLCLSSLEGFLSHVFAFMRFFVLGWFAVRRFLPGRCRIVLCECDGCFACYLCLYGICLRGCLLCGFWFGFARGGLLWGCLLGCGLLDLFFGVLLVHFSFEAFRLLFIDWHFLA